MNFDVKQYSLLEWDHAQGESTAKHVEGKPIWIDKRKIDYVYSIHIDHCVVGVGGKELYLYDRLSRVLNDLGAD
jgi:transposase-like protein